jgi:threonine dehydrogenase-like Zn-dependent dehydrogenase
MPAGAAAVPPPRGGRGADVHPIGLSEAAPGAYAERLVVEESLAFAVPNGLRPDIATLTEPLAVAWHAVRRGEVKKRRVAVVIGCGPIGLGVILMLKARGVRHVVASDFSAGRRALAKRCGADVVVDPGVDSPYAGEHGHLESAPEAFDLAMETVERLQRLRLPWWRVWEAAESLGVGPKSPVIFECVGVPGVIDGIVASAPLFSRVVVVGVCMGEDRIRPSLAINKEIELRFVLGYTPPEFRETLHMLAEGKVDPSPLLTGVVGLEGTEGAFDALGNPERHAKILIDPKRSDLEPAPV